MFAKSFIVRFYSQSLLVLVIFNQSEVYICNAYAKLANNTILIIICSIKLRDYYCLIILNLIFKNPQFYNFEEYGDI